MAKALASLDATLALGEEEGVTIPIWSCWVVPLDDEDLDEDVNMIYVLEVDTEDWRQHLIEHLEHENFLMTQGIR